MLFRINGHKYFSFESNAFINSIPDFPGTQAALNLRAVILLVRTMTDFSEIVKFLKRLIDFKINDAIV